MRGDSPRLTAAQVRAVVFSHPPIGKRGYNMDEVDEFLDLAAAQLDGNQTAPVQRAPQPAPAQTNPAQTNPAQTNPAQTNPAQLDTAQPDPAPPGMVEPKKRWWRR
ncbi:DivIVA domain-containing protein [Labedaea rhizosphaerae]|uniref:DivIVA domain-containing protein n=1 Tax=Labedaea rhizosphaerae TaxID=598644 RepID=UPI003C7C5791